MKSILSIYFVFLVLVNSGYCGKFIPVAPTNFSYSQGRSILRSPSPAVITRLRDLIHQRGLKIPFLEKIVNSSSALNHTKNGPSENIDTTGVDSVQFNSKAFLSQSCIDAENCSHGQLISTASGVGGLQKPPSPLGVNDPVDRQPRLALFLRKLRRWSNYQPEPGTSKGHRLDEQWQEFKKWRKKKRRRRQLRRKILREVFRELGFGDKDLLADILGTGGGKTDIVDANTGQKKRRGGKRMRKRQRRPRRNRKRGGRNRHLVKSGETTIENLDIKNKSNIMDNKDIDEFIENIPKDDGDTSCLESETVIIAPKNLEVVKNKDDLIQNKEGTSHYTMSPDTTEISE